jgi:spore coat polysaccharide biosynthesis protein SpsF
VATSTHPSDDTLAALFEREGIRCVRGSLDDVLDRFVAACADLDEDATVVRLTADNVFPDGALLAELEAQFERSSARYLALRAQDGYAFGLSAEIFDVGALRLANAQAVSAYEREHVTPFLARAFSGTTERAASEQSQLRCTIDTLDDYLKLAELFATERDPVGAHHASLLSALAARPDAPRFRIPYRVQAGVMHGAMALGTAQLGLPYGAANAAGMPSLAESAAIVRVAIAHGVTAIDTARAYGIAEQRIGDILRGGLAAQVAVTTKLSPMPELDDASTPASMRQSVDASVFRSCRELGLRSLPTLLLHRAEHRSLAGGAIWQRLLELKREGVVGKLGLSVYTVEEALRALDDAEVEQLQIPLNILDHRWDKAAFAERARSRPDLVIHARSALLQGVLAASPDAWPRNGGDAVGFVRKLDALARGLGRVDRADLCFAYARAQPFVTSVLVGVETSEQLRRNLDYFCRPPLSPEECELARTELAGASEVLLDPSRWEKR